MWRYGLAGLMLCVANSVVAGEFSVRSELTVEGRWFTQSPQFSGQSTDDDYSWFIQPELRYQHEQQQFTLIPFYRDDSVDEQRSHFDLRELHWSYRANDWDVLLGINRVFWGVAESRHLVDIINQTDAVEDIDGEDKLGQPMIQYGRITDSGTFNVFVLPGFRERTFAGNAGRFRSPLAVDTDDARYQSGQGDDHVDYALRYAHSLGAWDIGASYFYGTAREPRLLLNASSTALIPFYDLIRQFGVDIQFTEGAWLWKFEAIHRQGQGKNFIASVAGFEYTLYQITGAADLGLLLEYQYDDRDSNAPASGQDDDVFMGLRLAMNDIHDSTLLMGLGIDRHSHEQFYNFEAERRLTDHWKLELRARIVANTEAGSVLDSINRDDYIQLQIQYHL